MSAADPERPVVAVVHQLARTGGTLVNRCLGSMRDVLVLSEVHPLDPQGKLTLEAAAWFRLLSPEDKSWLSGLAGRHPAAIFAEIVARLAERSADRGCHLLLRDWSHLDFLGVPFVHRPPMQLLTEGALKDSFQLNQAFIVRHPIDQYASSASRPAMGPHLTPSRFLEGYLAFAQIAAARGFQRYEDFVAAPDDWLRKLCAQLRIPYDGSYQERWQAYDKLTGDSAGPSRGFSRLEIAPMPALPLDGATRRTLERNPAYRKSLDLLGYIDRGD